MKYRYVVLAIFLFVTLTSADTTSVVNGNLVNLYSLQKTRLPGTYSISWSNYSAPCSLNTDTLKHYDFIYEYYDFCTCICPCCPEVRITSPRPFYRSNAPMNYTAFNPALLATNFTEISGPDSAYAGQLTCSTLPSVTYGHTGRMNPMPVDSIRSRLFVFLSSNGGTLPYYQYMLVHIDAVVPYQYWCDPTDTGGPSQPYPLYNSANISIYGGPIAGPVNSIKQTTIPNYIRVKSEESNMFTIFGKRIDKGRVGDLPAGIYIVNGKKIFLQKNAPLSKVMNAVR